MSINFGLRGSAYQVSTPVYQGPLDLLLNLIESAQLDITNLALAHVTDQFLDHLQDLRELSAEDLSSFLIVASKLLQIKSEVLLPRPLERKEGEVDPGEALARQLLAYKRFRQIAEVLSEREEKGLHTHIRLAQPPKVEGKVDLDGIGLPDLLASARYIFAMAEEIDHRPALETVVQAPKVTIRQKIGLIASQLRNQGKTTFETLLDARRSRLDIVVTFLAVLELIRRHVIQAYQDRLFGAIELRKAEMWDEDQEFDLEFGE